MVVIGSLFTVACYRAYPPARPAGVPSSAVWAGGWDGGGWVTCTGDPGSEHNLCTIYDEQGRTRGPAQYRLKNLNRAAQPAELRYTYVTGQAIGLKGGLELVQVSRNQPLPEGVGSSKPPSAAE
jgi:hypothetical protein